MQPKVCRDSEAFNSSGILFFNETFAFGFFSHYLPICVKYRRQKSSSLLPSISVEKLSTKQKFYAFLGFHIYVKNSEKINMEKKRDNDIQQNSKWDNNFAQFMLLRLFIWLWRKDTLKLICICKYRETTFAWGKPCSSIRSNFHGWRYLRSKFSLYTGDCIIPTV